MCNKNSPGALTQKIRLIIGDLHRSLGGYSTLPLQFSTGPLKINNRWSALLRVGRGGGLQINPQPQVGKVAYATGFMKQGKTIQLVNIVNPLNGMWQFWVEEL